MAVSRFLEFLAALAAIAVIFLYGGAAIGAKAAVALGCRCVSLLGSCAKVLIQRVCFFASIGNIKSRVALFRSGIADIVNSADNRHQDKKDTKQAKETRCAHGSGGKSPYDAKDSHRQGSDTAHHGGTASGFDTFHCWFNCLSFLTLFAYNWIARCSVSSVCRITSMRSSSASKCSSSRSPACTG